MNRKIEVPFPSGKSWVTLEGGVQSLEVNKDEIIYIWDYSCEENIDGDDPKVGSTKKRYYGEKTMEFKFLSGVEFSYNQEHKKFMLHLFFSGSESIVIGCNTKAETTEFYKMVKQWKAFNKLTNRKTT